MRGSKHEQVLEGRHARGVTSVAISSDASFAISGSYDATLRVWDLRSKKCIKVLSGHSNKITCLAISADNSFAVSGAEDTTLRIWDLRSGECMHSLEGHWHAIACVAISEDASSIISAGNDRNLFVWNLIDGNRVAVSGVSCEIVERRKGTLCVSRSTHDLQTYNIENLPLGPFITTAQREVISEDLPAGPATARPACCGKLIDVPDAIAERIDCWTVSGDKGGYDDPALEMPCPQCGTPLKMNPFFMKVR